MASYASQSAREEAVRGLASVIRERSFLRGAARVHRNMANLLLDLLEKLTYYEPTMVSYHHLQDRA